MVNWFQKHCLCIKLGWWEEKRWREGCEERGGALMKGQLRCTAHAASARNTHTAILWSIGPCIWSHTSPRRAARHRARSEKHALKHTCIQDTTSLIPVRNHIFLLLQHNNLSKMFEKSECYSIWFAPLLQHSSCMKKTTIWSCYPACFENNPKRILWKMEICNRDCDNAVHVSVKLTSVGKAKRGTRGLM